jgi:hypothetical protein
MPDVGLVLTFFGPGCWMWQTNDADGEVEHEGLAGSREQAIQDAQRAFDEEER